MFGFLIGTLSLIGLIKVWKGGWHGGHGRGFGGPRRWMTRRLFEYLDTTPGQEKVLAQVMDEVEKKAWAARDQLHGGRSAFARAVQGEHFDGAAVGDAFDSQQAALEELKKTLREGMAKVHEALGPEQRRRLAELIEHGPRAMHGGHGHACGHHRHGSGCGWGGCGGWGHAHGGPAVSL